MNRKVPMRTCVVTREKYPKQELIRIVKNNDNQVFVDLTGKSNGRGAYIKKDLDVLAKAIKTKVLEKHLETCVVDNIKNGNTEITKEVMQLIKKLQ